MIYRVFIATMMGLALLVVSSLTEIGTMGGTTAWAEENTVENIAPFSLPKQDGKDLDVEPSGQFTLITFYRGYW